jgi:hypothetical protein
MANFGGDELSQKELEVTFNRTKCLGALYDDINVVGRQVVSVENTVLQIKTIIGS